MRKFLVAVLLTVFGSTSSFAHGYGHGGGGMGWVAPLIGGVVVGTILAQPRPVQAPVYVQPPPAPVPYYPGTVYPDYTYRPMYKAMDVFVPECNCYRTVMVQVN